MGQTCECGCRHGASPSPVEADHTARTRAPMPEDTVEAAARRSPHGLPILQRFGIVDGRGELVGDQAVLAEHHEIIASAGQVA